MLKIEQLSLLSKLKIFNSTKNEAQMSHSSLRVESLDWQQVHIIYQLERFTMLNYRAESFLLQDAW